MLPDQEKINDVKVRLAENVDEELIEIIKYLISEYKHSLISPAPSWDMGESIQVFEDGGINIYFRQEATTRELTKSIDNIMQEIGYERGDMSDVLYNEEVIPQAKMGSRKDGDLFLLNYRPVDSD